MPKDICTDIQKNKNAEIPKYKYTQIPKYKCTKHKIQLTCSPVLAMFLTGVPALLIIIQKPVCDVAIVISFNTFLIFNIVFIDLPLPFSPFDEITT